MSARSAATYTWSHQVTPVAAMSAKVLPALLETTRGTPAAAAARPSPPRPRGRQPAAGSSGRSRSGARKACPSRVAEVSTSRTSRRTWGAIRNERQASVASPQRHLVARALLDVAEDRRGQPLAGTGLHLVQRPGAGRPPVERLDRSSQRSTWSAELHAREVLLAPPQDQPAAGEQVAVAGDVVDVGDPLVVQVGAALGDRAARLALALRPARSRRAGRRRRCPWRPGSAPASRRAAAEGLGPELVQVTAAEQRCGRGLGVLGLLGAVDLGGDGVGECLLAGAQERLLGGLLPRAPRSPRGRGR